MGDARFDPMYERVLRAARDERADVIRSLTDEEVIAALGGASRAREPLLANVLATEAQNRAHRAAALAASLGDGVLAMDGAWRIVLANPAAERMLGWSAGQMRGKDPHDLIHPFCHAPEECRLGEPPDATAAYQADDALLMRRDGRTIRVAYSVTPMRSDGSVRGGLIIFRDASERKRREDEKVERIETIMETLAEGILVLDGSGIIAYANSAAARLLGRPKRDVVDRSYADPTWEFVDARGEPLHVMALPFDGAIRRRVPVRGFRLGVKRGDGRVARLSVNVLPLPDPRGHALHVLVSLIEAP